MEPGCRRWSWCWLDRRFRLGHGKVFALYVVLYTAGRFWIEALRIDTVNEIGGFRLNNYTSLIVFVAALIWFIWLVSNRPGREEVVEGDPSAPTRADRSRSRLVDDRRPPGAGDDSDERELELRAGSRTRSAAEPRDSRRWTGRRPRRRSSRVAGAGM